MAEVKRCGRCDRRLKNPHAREIGFGKTCYKKIQQAQQSEVDQREKRGGP